MGCGSARHCARFGARDVMGGAVVGAADDVMTATKLELFVAPASARGAMIAGLSSVASSTWLLDRATVARLLLVLRHAALHNPACVADRGVALLDAVDDSQDTSVHRELFKALLEAPEEELRRLGPELFDLGLGLCADASLPVAMVHVGVLLLHASGEPLGAEVAEVWRERGANAETAPLARFLAKQLEALSRR